MPLEKRLCEYCARQGKTCCQCRDIYVTPGDVERIAAYVGHRNFFEYRFISDPAYLDNQDDPVWMTHVFRSDNSRRHLKQNVAGDCVFLTEKGCFLPMEQRPLVCRMFPYNYHAGGLYSDLENGCPVHLLPVGQNLCQNLGMRTEDATRWHQMLYAEILTENHSGSKI